MMFDYDIRRIYNDRDLERPGGANVKFYFQKLVDDINVHVARVLGLPEFERTVEYRVDEDVYNAINDKCLGPGNPYIGIWGYIGGMSQCMGEIDSTIASIEENRKKITVVKSVIE